MDLGLLDGRQPEHVLLVQRAGLLVYTLEAVHRGRACNHASEGNQTEGGQQARAQGEGGKEGHKAGR
jgi:hypothetical protein